MKLRRESFTYSARERHARPRCAKTGFASAGGENRQRRALFENASGGERRGDAAPYAQRQAKERRAAGFLALYHQSFASFHPCRSYSWRALLCLLQKRRAAFAALKITATAAYKIAAVSPKHQLKSFLASFCARGRSLNNVKRE